MLFLVLFEGKEVTFISNLNEFWFFMCLNRMTRVLNIERLHNDCIRSLVMFSFSRVVSKTSRLVVLTRFMKLRWTLTALCLDLIVISNSWE